MGLFGSSGLATFSTLALKAIPAGVATKPALMTLGAGTAGAAGATAAGRTGAAPANSGLASLCALAMATASSLGLAWMDTGLAGTGTDIGGQAPISSPTAMKNSRGTGEYHDISMPVSGWASRRSAACSPMRPRAASLEP